MPTVKLIPSSYSLSSTYLSMSNAENMYSDVSSTTYATLTNTNASTSYFYCYINGFNISDIPANATVSSFSVKIRGRASGAYNSALYLCHGTTTISNATATQFPNSSSATTRTFSIPSTLTWATIAGYGSDFGIRINCRRNAKNTQSYYYIYGAEIEVTYTVPADVPPVITVGTPSTERISAITDYDQCVCTFTSDLALQAWEARATKAGTTPARGVGLLVESGGSLAANTPATIYVENEELTDGDGQYTITVYGQSTAGIWSE